MIRQRSYQERAALAASRAARSAILVAAGLASASASPRKRRAIRSRRATERRSDRVRSSDFLAWVHTQPCCAIGIPGHVCEGPIEADHMDARGLGQKCDDVEAAPLCRRAHRERTDFSGAFRSWDRARMRAWLAACVESTQAAHASRSAA